MSPRLVVLASGNGSNFQAIVDATSTGVLAADVVLLVCNRSDARAIDRARTVGVRVALLLPERREARADYDNRLAEAVAAASPDIVVLAGWMRMLSMTFLGRFPGKVVNLHPAMPGQFPGTNAIERAFTAGVARTGAMVHYVPDEGMDDGPVIATAHVEIHPDDTLETLSERVHAAERILLVHALQRIL